MTLSVLIPVYGVEKYIERCARSLFEQTLGDIEYVFVDDCSPDGSMEVLLKVLEEYPHRKPQVKIVRHEKNMGLPEARWTAIQNATADYVIACDSDDWVEPNMYEEMWKKQQETGADVVICDVIDHNSNGKIKYRRLNSFSKSPQEWLDKELLKSTGLWNKLMKKNIIIDNNLRAVAQMGEDYAVLPRVLYHARSIAYVNECLYHYDQSRPTSFTYKRTELKTIEDRENLDTVIAYFSEKKYNWKCETQFKLLVRNTFFSCSPIPWNEWRNTYPEVIDILKNDKSYTKVYRICYIMAHKGFTLPLIILRHLPSWKVWKKKLRQFNINTKK